MPSAPLSHLAAAVATTVVPYDGDADEWDTFVRRTPQATFFHLFGWKDVLARTFAFRPHYLAARRAGQLVGILPLCEVRSPLRRPRLLSLPLTVEGGVCAVDGDAQDALDAAALDVGAEIGAQMIELRDGLTGGGFAIRDGIYCSFRRAIFATDEENLAAMRPNQRRMVRVGRDNGLVARVDGDTTEFYDLFARAMRRLGTPVLPRRYFEALRERFGADAVLLTAYYRGVPAAACLSFFFGDTVLPYYVGSRRELFAYAVNDFMYWELMRYARARGARRFDFGRSRRGTGSYAFKRHWGFAPEPLRYRVHLADARTPPPGHGSGTAMRVLQRTWQHLPLPLTRLLGPTLMRHVGVYYT